jgi:hypothetical protein
MNENIMPGNRGVTDGVVESMRVTTSVLVPSHVHKITNEPGFYMVLDIIILMGANPLEGVGTENLKFLGPN